MADIKVHLKVVVTLWSGSVFRKAPRPHPLTGSQELQLL